jgi:hypothetical protein
MSPALQNRLLASRLNLIFSWPSRADMSLMYDKARLKDISYINKRSRKNTSLLGVGVEVAVDDILAIADKVTQRKYNVLDQ